MEVVVSHAGRRGCRERSVNNQGRMMSRPTFKKVQVVYYLSRNGQLEHPHYMEVTHLAHQQLRLKDVMDRLTVLRGKGMPSLYSWSCKRSYKNGFVWNDLSENDVIYPSEGAEYVLKGSELIQGCDDKLHHLQGVGKVGDLNFQSERSSLASKRDETVISSQLYGDSSQNPEYDNRNDAVQEEDEEIAPQSRSSRGVSTDDIRDRELNLVRKKNDMNINVHGPSHELSLDCNSSSVSPPSTNSSTLSGEPTNNSNTNNNNNNSSKRFEDVDEESNGLFFSRNSMLLSLIACGGSASFRKTVPPPKVGSDGGNLHKRVVCKAAEAVEEEEMVISCMSENPRFGNPQSEEKEYFSGSIVEAMKNEVNVEPGLKKSSSHNEERSKMMSGLGEEEEGEEEVKREKGVKGKCIPMKKSYTKQTKK